MIPVPLTWRFLFFYQSLTTAPSRCWSSSGGTAARCGIRHCWPLQHPSWSSMNCNTLGRRLTTGTLNPSPFVYHGLPHISIHAPPSFHPSLLRSSSASTIPPRHHYGSIILPSAPRDPKLRTAHSLCPPVSPLGVISQLAQPRFLTSPSGDLVSCREGGCVTLDWAFPECETMESSVAQSYPTVILFPGLAGHSQKVSHLLRACG